MSIEALAAARQKAELVLELADFDAGTLPNAGRDRYWETIAKHATAKLPKQPEPVRPEPMNDKAAEIYGATTMPFGQHVGNRLDDIPVEYLAMLVDDNEFKKQLRRYLQSNRVKIETLNAQEE